jgi:hypothetical protein
MFHVPGSRFVFWFSFRVTVRRAWLCVPLVALLSALHLAALFASAESRFRIMLLDASGTIPYFIDPGVEGSGFRPGDDVLARWALEEWGRSTGGAVRFERAARPEAALLRISWLPWAEDAALGRMEPTIVDGREGAAIAIRPDERRFRPSIRRGVQEDPLLREVVLYYVCLHEVGHALGLSHSDNPRDVMWPGNNGVTLPVYQRYRHRLQTRDDIPRTSWLSDGDIARFKEIW